MKWSGRVACPLFTLLLPLMPAPAHAQVAFEVFLGSAFNVPSTLTVTQAGYPPIKFRAHYDVRPLDDIWYYAYRLALWRNNKAWIAELLHHKVYLENPQGEVELFEVTHGYNLITLNRGWRRGNNILLFGGGVVVTSPHSTISWTNFSGRRGLLSLRGHDPGRRQPSIRPDQADFCERRGEDHRLLGQGTGRRRTRDGAQHRVPCIVRHGGAVLTGLAGGVRLPAVWLRWP